MQFHPHQSELRQRRYPVLSIFDVTLNVALSAGVVALGCGCLAIILSHNAPRLLGQIFFIASHIFR